ncbi:MAG TPA: right-handed parallel beta-helix repeat-containing protein [Pyrinomonadaceae bacterium]|nr:right-handed parallel beta-helix repeat-containing protein [Pyrinomonadaceae bacterium]
MTRLKWSVLRLTFSFIATILLTTAAQALPQTFVSATGNNVNSCERADPCRTFAGALIKTDAGGEIVVLDAGEYGPVNITKSVKITAVGVYAGINAVGGGTSAVAITVGATDVVVLRGLTITGAGAANGVAFTARGTLHVEGCAISGFTAAGISFTAAGQLFVKDSFVRNNNNSGIYFAPRSSTATASIDHCRMERNAYGVRAEGGTGRNPQVTIRDSVAADNTTSGFYATGAPAQMNVFDSQAVYNGGSGFYAISGAKLNAHHCLSANNATNGFLASTQGIVSAKDCTAANNTGHGMAALTSSTMSIEGGELVNNGSSGLSVSGGATALISDTMVTGNSVGLKNDGASTLKSFGNNQVNNNTTDKSGVITPVGLS